MIFVPLAGAIVGGLLLRPISVRRAGVLATLVAAASFVATVVLWAGLSPGSAVTFSVPWFPVGGRMVEWGFRFDALTAVMCLVVTGIGSVIHLFSIGYMSEDRTPARYFAYLNLFLFAMLVLVTADNLAVLFVGWEGVGLCSYLLIGYWYQDPVKAAAGMKAFLVNRIGDAGFLIGMFLCVGIFGTLRFEEIARLLGQADAFSLGDLPKLNLAALFLFAGAVGKSAQIPLFVWLPDAMAGPTPVSALIHAATMVTAGIYLVVRMSPLFQVAADASQVVAVIGGATALFAALIATSQRDIKKVLAYSTVSQLGLIFLALGCRAYLAGIFHVVTHAFFKALLFLGAGSVIHAMHGEQDILKMGGLRRALPHTFLTFTVGWLAICGIPPLSGFFSKDLILFGVLSNGGWGLWLTGTLASVLTAFYMTRLYVLVFLGQSRSPGVHPHESPPVMSAPLWCLAIGSAVVGFLELPHFLHLPAVFGGYLHALIPEAPMPDGPLGEVGAMLVATVLAVCSIALAFVVFSRASGTVPGWARPVVGVLEGKFFVDELYHRVIVEPFGWICARCARVIDPRIVDAGLMLPARLCRAGGTVLSLVQWGAVQFYLLVFVLGALAVLWAVMGRMVTL